MLILRLWSQLSTSNIPLLTLTFVNCKWKNLRWPRKVGLKEFKDEGIDKMSISWDQSQKRLTTWKASPNLIYKINLTYKYVRKYIYEFVEETTIFNVRYIKYRRQSPKQHQLMMNSLCSHAKCIISMLNLNSNER